MMAISVCRDRAVEKRTVVKVLGCFDEVVFCGGVCVF